MNLEIRCLSLKEGCPGEGPVVYWMQRDLRVEDNWALLYAQREALERQTDLIVVFCLVETFLHASGSMFQFMVSGVLRVQKKLQSLNIPFLVLEGDPVAQIPTFVREINAGLLVTDFNPLHLIKQWKEGVRNAIRIPFMEVDAHNICPVRNISEKQEYSAFTLRKKINRRLGEFLTEFPTLQRMPRSGKNYPPSPIAHRSSPIAHRSSPIAHHPSPIAHRLPEEQLAHFIANTLSRYPQERNDPNLEGQSGLSPYLHFGQLSAQRVALEVNKAEVPPEAKQAFLEELIVRRELADNFCFYNDQYDRFEGFPAWGQRTLNLHRQDSRQVIYDISLFEKAQTHDLLWNAAQMQLLQTGRMHGYMRMYWAKKILEWTPSPEEALAIAIYLNDSCSLDGRDPNGYAGIAWSIGGLHDRPWKERPVFGTIRYMNEAGCRRKFNVDAYCSKWHPER